MNNNSNENNKKSGYKVRRSNLTGEEVRKRVSRRQDTNSSAPGSNEVRKISGPVSRNQDNTQRPAAQRSVRRVPDTAEDNISESFTPPEAVRVGTAASAPAVSSGSSPAKKDKNNRTAKHKGSDFIKPTDVIRIKSGYDRIFLILVIVLTLFGLIMDFSASYAYAYSAFGDSFHFVKRQAGFAAGGFVVMFIAMHFDYQWIKKITVPVFIGTILALIYVLAYGVASGVAQRWIFIGGFSVQPSEFMKFSLVFMLALYISRNQDRITNYKNFRQSSVYGVFIPIIIIGIACGLVALERHFSGTIILFLIGMVVIFTGGARKIWLIGAAFGAAAMIFPAIMFVPYARERVEMLFHPENFNPTGKIWQTLQGLYAIGSGGLFGVGLGNSRQKHLYVSQPQNDFVFSIIAEELGFAGAILVIILFMLLIWRGFSIALKAPDTFSSLVVIGLISKVAIQSILNIAVVTNLIPNTGISLPFFSYGGTALLVQLGEMGVVLSISRYTYQVNPDRI